MSYNGSAYTIDQIATYFEHIICIYQCGFRKGYSAQHCLLDMIEKWKKIVDDRVPHSEGGMGGGGGALLRPSHDFLRKLSIKADAPHGAPLPLKNEAPPIEK